MSGSASFQRVRKSLEVLIGRLGFERGAEWNTGKRPEVSLLNVPYGNGTRYRFR